MSGEARRLNAARVAARRNAEAACAFDFLVYGDDEAHGPHAGRCVHADDPCSRTYDPMPYPEAEPADVRMYAGTGIGALYGLGVVEGYAAQMAGWNLAPRSTR